MLFITIIKTIYIYIYKRRDYEVVNYYTIKVHRFYGKYKENVLYSGLKIKVSVTYA